MNETYEHCRYCGTALHGSDIEMCAECQAMHRLIAENPQRARNVLDRYRLERCYRDNGMVFILILNEVENETV